MTVENRDDTAGGRERNNSSSTDPLVTDSFSGESDQFEEKQNENFDSRMASLIKNTRAEIQEQWGYDPKKLNRIKMRREHELEEFNFGINFTQLKVNKE